MLPKTTWKQYSPPIYWEPTHALAVFEAAIELWHRLPKTMASVFVALRSLLADVFSFRLASLFRGPRGWFNLFGLSWGQHSLVKWPRMLLGCSCWPSPGWHWPAGRASEDVGELDPPCNPKRKSGSILWFFSEIRGVDLKSEKVVVFFFCSKQPFVLYFKFQGDGLPLAKINKLFSLLRTNHTSNFVRKVRLELQTLVYSQCIFLAKGLATLLLFA